MALKEIQLSRLVDTLDDKQSPYADFFRPMLGYEAILKLYNGIDDTVEPALVEVEDEMGYTFPADLLEFYLCTNGGEFGDLTLYPITIDASIEKSINKLNTIDKSLKQELSLNNSTLLVGEYREGEMYVICYLNDDGVYSYALYDTSKKQIKMEFEYLVQIVALEVSYETDYDGLMEYAKNQEEK